VVARDRKQEEMRNRIFEVLEYMERHYREELTTQSVAEQFGITREYFCRQFKRYTNQTFKDYLTGLRLSATVKEMRYSDKRARQIALCQGFPDEKSFIAAFKKEFGTTPARWRAENLPKFSNSKGRKEQGLKEEE
jgi:YesN/AraC family two-component response regulator